MFEKIKEKCISIIKIIYLFIKKNKTYFIVGFCILLFLLGFIRDRIKNKNRDDQNTVVTNNKEEKTTFKVRIYGGVNKAIQSSYSEEVYLFSIILNDCNGLSPYASIDKIDFTQIIKEDFSLYIEETTTQTNYQFVLFDYTKTNNYIYKYSVEDNNINIYKIDSNLKEEDFQLLIKEKKNSQQSINLNTCSLEELLTIDGLSASKANAIISYREENGKFNSLEDILNIKGIGKATVELLQGKVCVN